MKNIYLKLILFLIAFFTFAYFTRIGNVNAYSRLALVYALVDNQTFAIDNYHKIAGAEKSFYNGHYYTDKAIGLALFSVPIYFTLKQLGKVIYFKKWLPEKIPYLIKIFSLGLTSALFVVIFYSFLELLNLPFVKCLLFTFVFVYATPILQWSTVFYAHQFASFLFFISFYFLYYQKIKNKFSLLKLFISGSFLGFAFLSDYPIIIFSIPILFYLFFIFKKKLNIFFFILGLIPSIFIFSFYHYICFGKPFVLATSYHVQFETGNIRNTPPSTLTQEISFLNLPQWQIFRGITFSRYRGLFFYSPVLLLFILGGYFLSQNKNLKKEFYFFSTLILFYFYFLSTRNIWAGGSASTLRYLVILVPYLVIFLSYLPSRYNFIFLPLLFYSVIVNLIVNVTLPEVPPHIANPLYFDYKALLKFAIDKNLGNTQGLGAKASLVLYLGIIFLGWIGIFMGFKEKV